MGSPRKPTTLHLGTWYAAYYRAIEFIDPSQVPSTQSMVILGVCSERLQDGKAVLASLLSASFHWVPPNTLARNSE